MPRNFAWIACHYKSRGRLCYKGGLLFYVEFNYNRIERVLVPLRMQSELTNVGIITLGMFSESYFCLIYANDVRPFL